MFLKRKRDINKELELYRATPGAVLLDVRTKDEYGFARLPGSINVPLNKLKSAASVIGDPDTPVFVYCVSGARADKAVKRLQRQGFTNVNSIGGLDGYQGEIEKG